MIVPPLHTDRLTVRPLVRSDLHAVARILDDGPPDDARERWLEWTVLGYEQHAALLQPPYGERAVVRAEDRALVGLVGLVPSLVPLARRSEEGPFTRHPLPEIGLYWATAPDSRGRGYATEAARALIGWAFEALGVARIVATTEHDNLASVRVMEHLGLAIHRNASGEPPWLQVVGVLERP